MEGIVQAIMSIAKNILRPVVVFSSSDNQLVQSGTGSVTMLSGQQYIGGTITFLVPFDNANYAINITADADAVSSAGRTPYGAFRSASKTSSSCGFALVSPSTQEVNRTIGFTWIAVGTKARV